MKITCLFGSPRKNGNSSGLARKFLKAAENKGVEVKTYNLNTMNYKGCQACYACKKESEKCILKDDLTEALDDVANSDLLVMSTPIYYGDVSSQLKGFIDRTFSYLTPDYVTSSKKSRLSGKQMLMVVSQGQPDPNFFKDVFEKYNNFYTWMGFKNNKLIRACGVRDIGDYEKKKDILRLVEEIADEIL